MNPSENEGVMPVDDAPPIEIGDCGVDLDDCPFAAPSCDGCEQVDPNEVRP